MGRTQEVTEEALEIQTYIDLGVIREGPKHGIEGLVHLSCVALKELATPCR